MARNITPQQAAANWQKGMSNSTDKLKAGVNSVTVNPMEQAANAQDRYIAGIQKAVSSGKWQAGLRRKSLQDWKDAMNNKGAARVASGATAAVPKVQAFMGQFLPYINSVVSSLPPRGDLETNIQRANAVMRGAANFQMS